MKFLVDAQLPARLAHFLVDTGQDALHTSELPDGNRTSDSEINRVPTPPAASLSRRIAISATATFYAAHRIVFSSFPPATSRTTTCWHSSNPISTRSSLCSRTLVSSSWPPTGWWSTAASHPGFSRNDRPPTDSAPLPTTSRWFKSCLLRCTRPLSDRQRSSTQSTSRWKTSTAPSSASAA